MGVTPQAVNKWRHKGTFLVIDNLYILSGMLGVSIDELIIPKTWKEQTFLIETRC
jgi:transcriptional regulator with XRE-family HTH domain